LWSGTRIFVPSRHLVSSIVLKQTWDAAKKQKPHGAVKRVNHRCVREKWPTCNVMLSFSKAPSLAVRCCAGRISRCRCGNIFFLSSMAGACVEVKPGRDGQDTTGSRFSTSRKRHEDGRQVRKRRRLESGRQASSTTTWSGSGRS